MVNQNWNMSAHWFLNVLLAPKTSKRNVKEILNRFHVIALLPSALIVRKLFGNEKLASFCLKFDALKYFSTHCKRCVVHLSLRFGFKSANLKMRLAPMFKGDCSGDFLYYSTSNCHDKRWINSPWCYTLYTEVPCRFWLYKKPIR